MTGRIAQLKRDLAAAQSCATTLAVSMHRQHYAGAAPNWQPLPDLVGLLTQIDNMYAGLRNDLEAAKVENKRLVGMNLATLREDLAAAQGIIATYKEDYSELMTENRRVVDERDQARAEAAALRAGAERYEHIRLGLLYQGPRAIWFDFETGRWEPVSGEHLDRRTDQAIEARKEGV